MLMFLIMALLMMGMSIDYSRLSQIQICTCKQFKALWLKFDNFKRFFPASFWALFSSEFRIAMRNILPYIFPICIFISKLIEFLMFPFLVFSGQGIAMDGVRQPFLKALLQKLHNYRSRECSMFE